ncbi:alpha/beta hydrolase [Sphingomonas profundi]|uniref:alpha/beta hydrolase n=1 Tax=Alterirhizorhabdus profundi TaxID=2681549 RepID=UPI0012E8C804|nr:alpha/beta hydrolase [Sphingomonas profundi]
MNLEPKARAFLDALRAAALPPMNEGTPEAARAAMRLVRRAIAAPPLARVEDHVAEAAGLAVPVRLYVPEGDVAACLLYCHGGGWVVGSVEDSDGFARVLAARTACAVVSVDYRLAPEHPFPAAIDDTVAALTWLIAARQRLFGGEPPVGLIGDSAGANLVAVAARLARDAGMAPTFQILAYPVTDAAMDTASYAAFGEDLLLTPDLMAWFWRHYADAAARNDPRASPLRAESLAGLPPAFVLTAENDVLRDEGEAYGAALLRAGVPVICRRYSGQIHGFLTLVGMFDGGAAALDDIATYVAAHV